MRLVMNPVMGCMHARSEVEMLGMRAVSATRPVMVVMMLLLEMEVVTVPMPANKEMKCKLEMAAAIVKSKKMLCSSYQMYSRIYADNAPFSVPFLICCSCLPQGSIVPSGSCNSRAASPSDIDFVSGVGGTRCCYYASLPP